MNSKFQKIDFYNTVGKKILVLLILVNSILFNIIYPWKALYPRSLEEELEQIKREKEQTRSKLEEIKKEESGYIKQVNEVEQKLTSALAELEQLNVKLSEVKSGIDKTNIELMLKEKELVEIEEELQSKISILNQRVSQIYKNQNRSFFEILFKTDNFLEFMSRLKMINLLAEQDIKMVQEIKDKKNAILDTKRAIIELREREKDQKENIEKLLSQSEDKKRQLEDIYNQKKELLTQTLANKNALIAMERQLSAKEAEITRILESYKYGSAPTGKLAWPTNGRISSGFGSRRSSLSGSVRFHAGIDLYAPNGTPVIAADGGQVIQAGYYGGYGYSVLIYHGGGFATFYAHLSGFTVSPGQMVQRGQLIGFVGTTGWTTGPHLHFEVRINGIPQNPLNYL